MANFDPSWEVKVLCSNNTIPVKKPTWANMAEDEARVSGMASKPSSSVAVDESLIQIASKCK